VVFKKLFLDIAEGDCKPEIIAVRRLYWESYSGAAVAMHRRMAPDTEADKPRQPPKEERTSRLAALKTKLAWALRLQRKRNLQICKSSSWRPCKKKRD